MNRLKNVCNKFNFDGLEKIAITLTTSLFISLICIGTGCARTVTEKTPIIYASVTISFRSPIDTLKYNYYLMLRHTTATSGTNPILLIPPIPSEYSPTPGFPFNDDNEFINSHKTVDDELGLNFYYTSYFDTWSDYFIYNDNGLTLYKSNALVFDSTTTQNAIYDISYDSGATAAVSSFDPENESYNLTITFPTYRLSNAASRLFFAAATSLKIETDTSGTGYSQDILKDNSAILDISSAYNVTNQIIGNPYVQISGSADIIGLEASTF